MEGLKCCEPLGWLSEDVWSNIGNRAGGDLDPANIPELAWLWNEGEPNRFRVPLGEEAFGAEKNPALPSVKKTI